MRPKVSIIMPVLNGERYIGEAIESILAQTYTNYELVVVDDGSTDRTRECVDSFMGRLDLKYVAHAVPKGIPHSMNDGILHSSGELIAFLDHDDGWFPDFLETQVSYLQEHKDVGMVHSDFQTTDVSGNVIEASVAASRNGARPSGEVFPQLFMESFIVGNSVLIRKECFTRLGLFDEGLRWGDYHMWMRIALHYRVDYVPRVMTSYRQHPTQSTRTMAFDRPYEESVGLLAIRKILEAYPDACKKVGARNIRHRIANLHFDMAYNWWSANLFANARTGLAKAIRLWPTNSRYYAMYAASLFRPSLVKGMREQWRRLRGLPTMTRGAIG